MSTTFNTFHANDSDTPQRSVAIWVALVAAVLAAATVLAPSAKADKSEARVTASVQSAPASNDYAQPLIQSEPFGAALGVLSDAPAPAITPDVQEAVDLQQVVLSEPFAIPQAAMK